MIKQTADAAPHIIGVLGQIRRILSGFHRDRATAFVHGAPTWSLKALSLLGFFVTPHSLVFLTTQSSEDRCIV